MRFFLDGHSRIYVDDDLECKDHHGKKDPPLYHVIRQIGQKVTTAQVVRCPASLTDQERSRLKEKP